MVLYNPYLTRYFKTHINIEISSSVQAIKCNDKSIYKSSDYAIMQIDIEKDKIAQYLQGQYIEPTTAMLQIFAFLIYEKFTLIK